MNVVPLVDVVLVLLIIFMLTAHVMDFGLEVDVPKVKITRETPDVLPVVSVDRNGNLYLNGKPVNINNLPDQIGDRFHGQTIVYVQADRSVRWDLLAQVMAELSGAKLQLRMVMKPLEGGRVQ